MASLPGSITIAASKATGPNSSLYTLADPEYLGHAVEWADNARRKFHILTRRPLSHDTGFWPLLNRGWVYQERILSPRVLHFADQELVWECTQGLICECSQSMNILLSTLPGKLSYHQMLNKGEPTSKLLRNRWRDKIEEYSNLNLTFSNDRLPALAGLAQQMHQLRQKQSTIRYLAGLWSDSLIGDMLWLTCEGKSRYIRLKPRSRPKELIAPSWSWACFEPAEPHQGVGASRISYDAVGKIPSAMSGSGNCEDILVSIHATVLGAECRLVSDANPFGQVTSGNILLSAPVLNGVVQIGPYPYRSTENDEPQWEARLRLTQFERSQCVRFLTIRLRAYHRSVTGFPVRRLVFNTERPVKACVKAISQLSLLSGARKIICWTIRG
jgi:hypothetical protein